MSTQIVTLYGQSTCMNGLWHFLLSVLCISEITLVGAFHFSEGEHLFQYFCESAFLIIRVLNPPKCSTGELVVFLSV